MNYECAVLCRVKILGTSIDSIDIAEDRDLFRDDPPEFRAWRPRHGSHLRRSHAPRIRGEGRGRDSGSPFTRPFGFTSLTLANALSLRLSASLLTAHRPFPPQRSPVSRRRLVITSRRRREWSVSGTVSIGEADALSDGEHVYIPSVMEHVELAGVHSGDSACIIPPVTITKE